MKKRIKAISDTDNGSLVIGGSSHASYLILSQICAEFYINYPQINMTLDIGNVGTPQILFEKLEPIIVWIKDTAIWIVQELGDVFSEVGGVFQEKGDKISDEDEKDCVP